MPIQNLRTLSATKRARFFPNISYIRIYTTGELSFGLKQGAIVLFDMLKHDMPDKSEITCPNGVCIRKEMVGANIVLKKIYSDGEIYHTSEAMSPDEWEALANFARSKSVPADFREFKIESEGIYAFFP